MYYDHHWETRGLSNSPPPMLKWVRYRRVNFSSVTIYMGEVQKKREGGGKGREEVKDKGGEMEGK